MVLHRDVNGAGEEVLSLLFITFFNQIDYLAVFFRMQCIINDPTTESCFMICMIAYSTFVVFHPDVNGADEVFSLLFITFFNQIGYLTVFLRMLCIINDPNTETNCKICMIP